MTIYSISNPPILLDFRDQVLFNLDSKTLTYEVRKNHLSNGSMDNAKIFKELGVNKKDLADHAYGYECHPGGPNCWPETNRDDHYEAMTRLVWLLFELIQKKKGNRVYKFEEYIVPPENIEKIKEIYTLGKENWGDLDKEIRSAAFSICGAEFE